MGRGKRVGAAKEIIVPQNPLVRPRRLAAVLEYCEIVASHKTPLAVIRHITRQNALDPRLAPADRLMQRWAASQGSGLAALMGEASDEVRQSTLSPLDDQTAMVADRIVLKAPYRWPRFIHSWYRSSKPAEVIGEEMGISRSAVYTEHKVVLGYLTGMFEAYGIPLPQFPGIAGT
jgi:hypothetical protein